MEQTIQKPPLPTKTKIAAWWMIIMGGFIIIDSLLQMVIGQFGIYMTSPAGISFFSIIHFFVGSSLCAFSLRLIFRKNKSDWVATIIILSIILLDNFLIPFIPPSPEPVSLLFSFLLVYFFHILGWFSVLSLFVLPLILLLLDRKNFWKIAT